MTTPAEDDIPSFTLVASDPAAPFALLAYSAAARNRGATPERVAEIKALVQAMYRWQDTHGVIPLGKSLMMHTEKLNEKIDVLWNTEEENP